MVKLIIFNLQFPQLYRWLFSLPSGLQSVLLVAVYIITGLVLDEVAAVFETADEVTAWYPPAGLHIVLLLRFGLRYIPELLFVPLLDGLVFSPLDIAPLYVLIEALCIMLGYGTACALLLQKLQVDPGLPHFRDVLWFTIVALVASLIVAASSVTTFAEAGNISWSLWGVRVLHLWAGDATGIALLAPPLLLVLRVPKDGAIVSEARKLPQINIFSWQRRQVLEWIAETVALVVVGWVAYGLPSITNLDYSYFIFLPIIWISMRHGFQRTVLAVLLLNISVAIYVGTKLSDTNQLALQFGLMTVSYTGLLVGAVITEQNRGKQQLLYDASHDRLTKLYNRSGFTDKLEQAFARASVDENYLFAVIFLDLDRFKVVNDSLGHPIGDRLLSAIAQPLKSCLRTKDIIARFGGDEFTILLEDIQAISDATDVAQQINQKLAQSFNLDGYYAFTTASIGIALYSLDYQQPADLIRDANIAMYRAKAEGRGRYAVFDKAMHEDVVMLSQLENDLRRDVQKIESQPLNKFQLYYQPLVSLSTGRIIGFEALIRWHHPIRGLVCPAHFIPLAEETGMIVPIGYWVLREACRQMQTWQLGFCDKAPAIIAVNLSARQFLQLDLVERIDSILQETGLKPSSLTLEITETIVMENSEEAALMLLRLKALGVRLSIDDFGTGYSSLSRLHSFPVNTLKIDRSFVNQIGSSGENSEIVQAIVMLAEHIGVSVTAEGVETTAQLTKLKELNCDEAQGYFFSRPLNSHAAQELIAASPQWY